MLDPVSDLMTDDDAVFVRRFFVAEKEARRTPLATTSVLSVVTGADGILTLWPTRKA